MISGAHFSGIKFIKICAQGRQRGKLSNAGPPKVGSTNRPTQTHTHTHTDGHILEKDFFRKSLAINIKFYCCAPYLAESVCVCLRAPGSKLNIRFY